MYSSRESKHLTDTIALLKKSEGSIEELRNALRFHEYRYYIMSDPLISDEEYDLLYKRVEAFEKENPQLITPDSPTQRVGSSLNAEFVSVLHLVPMLSLENSYNPADLVAWAARLKGLVGVASHYSAEPKFDGASISLIYENDLLVRGATRGDGTAGDEITNNLRQLGSIPLSAKFSEHGISKIEIRGEVLLNKQNFKSYNESLMADGLPPLANPRNAAAGSLRMKDPAAVRKRKLEAILYHVSYALPVDKKKMPIELSTHHGTLKLLSGLGFKTPLNEMKVFSSIDEVILFCDELGKNRDELPYEIDGVVIKINETELQQQAGATSHHPRWAIAFKFKARQATSRLTSIEYQVGRTGAVTPVAKIEPVFIGGVTVTSVSLFNAGIVEEKDLRIGDTVIVERAGDVIPYIVKSLAELRTGKEKKIIFPENCPVCNSILVKPEGEAVWRCDNISCEAQVVERIIHFVSKDAMDIKSFGEANVKKFLEEGIITDIPSIYKIDFGQIAALPGFGERSVVNLKTAIEASRAQPLHRLIFGLGIRYVGQTTAKVLAKNVKNIFELETLSLEQLSQLKDIGTKVSESIFEFFKNGENRKMIDQLKDFGVNINGEHEEPRSGVLSGKTFLFTGTLPGLKRNDAEKMAEEQGGRLLSSVSNNLDYLVAGESAGSKLDKAKKIKSIKVISESEFLELLQG